MGPLMYDDGDEEPFVGRSAGAQSRPMADETAKRIDEEVRRIIDECYATAQRLLEENREKLDMMAEALMTYETIDSDQIDDIMAGRKPREPYWSDDDQGGGSAPSQPSAGDDDSAPADDPIGGPAGEH